MGVVDRTDEFRQLVMGLSGGVELPDLRDGAPSGPQSELNQVSAEIGKQIHETGLRVANLRRMAKKKGIFNDQTDQIQELTFGAKNDIQKLGQAIEALELKAKGCPNSTLQKHASNMVDTLKTRLLEVTKDFKDALEDRTKALEQQDKRRQMYSSGGDRVANPFTQKSGSGYSGNADDPEAGVGGSAMAGGGQQALYYNSRTEAVQNVQRTIGELATMFQKMAVMVSAQEEMIHRIDHDIDDTLQNVEQGQSQLLSYFQNISSNRALILKVFMILILFVVFFIVFLA